MRISFIVIAAVAVGLMLPSASHAQSGDCGQWPTCETCISHNLCGWCSENVTYPTGATGPRCAGFDKNGSKPFTCTGIYSTEQCVQGWSCSLVNFTCYRAAPGHGTRKEDCEANCTNQGQVFLCNHTTKKCYQVPSGTPGATSEGVCEASCIHPSSHPSSPHPVSPTPPAATYACNYTTGQCVATTPGHGSSKSVCEQTCTKSTDNYYCNKFTHKCVKLPPGSGGEPLQTCEKTCLPHPNPGPPPQFLGIWRGIAIQHGYKVGEWDMEFTQNHGTIVDIREAVTIKGIPFHVINGDDIDLWLNVTSGPGTGQVIKAIGKTEDRGPETNFLSAAFSEPGGDTPSSITAAMTDGKSKVFFLSECAGTPECIFEMPSGISSPGRPIFKAHRPRPVSFVENLPNLLSGATEDVEAAALKVMAKKPKARALVSTDPCEQYGANCSYCISHQYCGWCSEDVTYKGGQKGSQCAGFSSDPSKSDPFICKGRYSTTQCLQGYDCNKANMTCVPNPNPGNGHSLKVCEAECMVTPAPTQLAEYICNLTTKQCHKCNETFCPGAMPQAQCAQACVKPHHGPSTLVKGIWRGIEINEHYSLGEFDLVFNASAVAAYKDNKKLWEGTIESYGGDVMVYSLPQGKIPAIYTIADQSGMYGAMTMAFGLPNGQVPQGFAPSMQTSGMYEWVLAKCQNQPCDFRFPES